MEKTLNRVLIYSGKVVNLRVDDVLLEDGKKAKREVVEHRGAVVIVPLLEGERIVMVKQYRYPVGEDLLELPAGTLEEGESPLEGAKRELLEETGYTAQKMTELTSFYSSPGFCDERIHLFLAKGLKAKKQDLDSDERIDVELYTLDELVNMIKGGKIRDAKSIVGILYYLLLCDEGTFRKV